ncbi:MAG: hypothetical protein U0822_12875 [Anaerolineae bacterium]
MSSRRQADTSPPRLIRASEIGQYSYCARGWWLNVVQGRPIERTRLAAGTEAHARHGQRVRSAVWQGRLALALLGLGLVVLVLAWLR